MLRAYGELTTRRIADGLGDHVVVLPCAAIEAHGPHLPLATDLIILEGILARLPADLPALALPMNAIGVSTEHEGFAGTLSFEAETLLAEIRSIGGGLARVGARRMLLLSGHGGNRPTLEIASQQLRARHGMLAACAHILDGGRPPEMPDEIDPDHDWHGGAIETSMMLALRPDLVRADQIASGAGSFGRAVTPLLAPHGPVAWGWRSEDLDPSGVLGDASRASAELGRLLLDHAAGFVAALIGQLAAMAWDKGAS